MDLEYNQVAKIKVFGIGGAGCNAVNRMVEEGVQGVEFYVANTDMQDLNKSPVENKIILGRETTRGLGVDVVNRLPVFFQPAFAIVESIEHGRGIIDRLQMQPVFRHRQ